MVMHAMHPFDVFGHHHSPFQQRTTRTPPRTPSPTGEARVQVIEKRDAYAIKMTAPDDNRVLHNATAQLDRGDVVVQASVASASPSYQYQTRQRSGIYSAPSRRALEGVVPAGKILLGGPPDHSGFIELNDGESYALDDGSLALVGKPSKPKAFAKRVSLPEDADPRNATSEPLGDGSGGLLVHVPRVCVQPPKPARQDARPAAAWREATKPAVAPRRPAPSPPAKPTAASTSAAGAACAAAAKQQQQQPPPTPAAPSSSHAKDMTADEYKQQHKKAAAAKRAGLHEELSVLMNSEGPVLVECDASEASARNVQSPTEQVEDWVAIADGRFVKGGAPGLEVLVNEVVKEQTRMEVDDESSDDELAWMGF